MSKTESTPEPDLGAAGAQLSTAYANAWFENMVQGRGFIAVAVVIFAARQPFKVAAGAYLFGAALALSPALQARGVSINQFALNAIPYVATIVVRSPEDACVVGVVGP